MEWVYLFFAGIFEIVWAVGLKYTDGFTRLYPSLFTLVAMGVSFLMLSLAIETIPMGTAYAVWTGIGAVGVALIGMVFFGDVCSLLRVSCLGMIIAGILGLKFIGA